MSKGRMIDRKIRTSQTFAGLSYRQRDLWQGLIVMADDQGRMPGHPAYIRSAIWPYDDIPLADVTNDLKALEDAGNIILYTVDGSNYLQIVKWHIYQSDAEWLGLSDYPAPQGWQDHARYHAKGNKIETLHWETRRMLPTDYLATTLPLPCRDGDCDVKGSGEVEGEVEPPAPAPAAKASTARTIPAMLMRVAGLSTIPPDEEKRTEQITCLIETHGMEKVEPVFRDNAQKWRATKNKNGKPYPITNMGWVDWAQNELDSGSNGNGKITLAKWEKMSEEERYAHVNAGGDIPYE